MMWPIFRGVSPALPHGILNSACRTSPQMRCWHAQTAGCQASTQEVGLVQAVVELSHLAVGPAQLEVGLSQLDTVISHPGLGPVHPEVELSQPELVPVQPEAELSHPEVELSQLAVGH